MIGTVLVVLVQGIMIMTKINTFVNILLVIAHLHGVIIMLPLIRLRTELGKISVNKETMAGLK